MKILKGLQKKHKAPRGWMGHTLLVALIVLFLWLIWFSRWNIVVVLIIILLLVFIISHLKQQRRKKKIELQKISMRI